MQRHSNYTNHTDRYFQIGIAIFSFVVSIILVALVCFSMLSLSAMSQQ